ncbi:MAG TPA: YetF domain-containing protein, partial [Pirellulales bacterium]
MWEISLPHWWEFVLRAVIVYLFMVVLLRLTGKRQVGQLAPFDLVLLLVLSNAVQNSMNGGDNSITGGMILACTLVGINSSVGWLAYRSKRLEALVEGRPIILIHDGKIDHVSLEQTRMTMHELEASLRAAGCAGPAEVRFAVLENTGKVSVIPLQNPNEVDGNPT